MQCLFHESPVDFFGSAHATTLWSTSKHSSLGNIERRPDGQVLVSFDKMRFWRAFFLVGGWQCWNLKERTIILFCDCWCSYQGKLGASFWDSAYNRWFIDSVYLFLLGMPDMIISHLVSSRDDAIGRWQWQWHWHWHWRPPCLCIASCSCSR
jgi:hypothetical protein